VKSSDVALAVLVMLLWALCYPVITVGLEHAPPLKFAASRALLAGAVLVGAGLLMRRPFPSGWRRWTALTAVGLTATTMGFGGMFLAGGIVSPGVATVISNAQPLIAAPIAAALLGERLGSAGLGLLLGFGGIVMIAVPSISSGAGSLTLSGTGLVLLAALGVAIGNVMMKALAGKVDSVMGTGAQLLIGAVPLSVVAVFAERGEAIQWNGVFVAALAVLALFGTALAFILWFALLGRARLNRLNLFTFLTPVVALTLSAVAFGERLTSLEMGGSALVVATLVVSAGANQGWFRPR
jgi:drug/metabolite transporter (DMT)-like permease